MFSSEIKQSVNNSNKYVGYEFQNLRVTEGQTT